MTASCSRLPSGASCSATDQARSPTFSMLKLMTTVCVLPRYRLKNLRVGQICASSVLHVAHQTGQDLVDAVEIVPEAWELGRGNSPRRGDAQIQVDVRVDAQQ
jgi:hypothetical protein